MQEHVPVLLNEVIAALNGPFKKDSLVVDGTLGRGGHFFEMLLHFDNLIGIDADPDSIAYVTSRLLDQGFSQQGNRFTKDHKSVEILNTNFTNIKSYLISNELTADAVLVDLGISMYHYKESHRGFSFLNLDEELDMRIDPINNNVKASDLVNKLSERDLITLFINLGQEYNAKYYVKNLVHSRERKKIKTVGDFLFALKIKTVMKYKIHPATKIFMALRIAVNSEHLNLKALLNNFVNDIEKGLLFLIITFHSLEEKTVENFCNLNRFNFKKVIPTEEEIIRNKSSRSAKLFIIKNA